MDPALLENFGSPRALLQQYRATDSDTVWAKFDAAALQRALDIMGQPIWGAERPETLLWLVVDAGNGRREILGQKPDLLEEPRDLQRELAGDMRGDLSRDLRRDLSTAMPAGLVSNEKKGRSSEPSQEDPLPEMLDTLREQLVQIAASRGVPLVLPLMDTEDLVAVNITDIWGNFTDPVVAASARYDVDAILIGRARLDREGAAQIRWSLLLDDERFDWVGDISEGPHGVADRFATRLATSVSAASQIMFSVTGIDTFSQYGEVANYLKAMAIVESCEVQQVSGGSVVFDLTVRGDKNRLVRTIALGRVLQPAVGSSELPAGTNTWPSLDNSAPDLKYRFSGTAQ